MPKDFQDQLDDVADDIAGSFVDSGREFWNKLKGEDLPEARQALRRLAENNLLALTDPAQAERYHLNARHNLNTLANLTSGGLIDARIEARDMMKSVMDAVMDLAFAAIDAAL